MEFEFIETSMMVTFQVKIPIETIGSTHPSHTKPDFFHDMHKSFRSKSEWLPVSCVYLSAYSLG